MTFKALDPTEHYPLPMLDRDKFRGRGITLGCTHADCHWVLGRQVTDAEGAPEFIELFALYHPHGRSPLSGRPRIGAQEAGFPPLPDVPGPVEPPEVVSAPVSTPEVVETPSSDGGRREDDADALIAAMVAPLVEAEPQTECHCPPEMPMRLRRIYHAGCPIHGEVAG